MTQITRLGIGGYTGQYVEFGGKTPANYPAVGLLVEEFDIWQEGYQGSTVSVYYAGTTTLMPIYSDPELTERISNPQILTSRTDSSGTSYGKFATNVYSPFAYELDIDSSQQTGVRYVPIYTLQGEDASDAVATVQGGTVSRSLRSRFADVIRLVDYGDVNDSAVTNTTTLSTAISAAVDNGGGIVELPAGNIPFRNIQLPANVFLRGAGKGVTVLQSQLAGKVITCTGDNVGLLDLTLDGISQLSGSFGLHGRGIEEVVLENVEIKRFQCNVYWQGGKNHYYTNFDTTSGQILFRARGDRDAANQNDGDVFTNLNWIGGSAGISTGTGIELYVIDRKVGNNCIRNIRIHDNVGVDGAVNVYGASRTLFDQCIWEDNVYNLIVNDNPSAALSNNVRRVSGLHITGGSMTDGEVKLNGWCEDVVLSGIELDTIQFTLSTPTNLIMCNDSTLRSVTTSGESTKFLLNESRNLGTARVTTTGATATTIYRKRLDPNRIALFDVLVIGERVNGTDNGVMHFTHAAKGAVATLAYDNQTANYTAGNTITGSTSGATATIIADSDSGTSGTLSLGNVVGTFIDNEVISETGGGSGSAQANGILVEGSAALIGSKTDLHTAGSNAGALPAGWAATLAVSGQEALVQVTGAANNTIQWDAKVNCVYRD